MFIHRFPTYFLGCPPSCCSFCTFSVWYINRVLCTEQTRNVKNLDAAGNREEFENLTVVLLFLPVMLITETVIVDIISFYCYFISLCVARSNFVVKSRAFRSHVYPVRCIRCV